MSLGFDDARRRRLLDPRGQSLRRRTAALEPTRATASYDAALSAARPDHDARSAFNIAYRFGAIFLSEAVSRRARPARSGDRAAREGPRASARALAVHARHRLRLLLVAAATTRRPRRAGSSGGSQMPGAPTWLQPLAATTLAEGGDRDAVAHAVAADLRDVAEEDWLRRTADVRLLQLDALDEIDQLQRARRAAPSAHRPGRRRRGRRSSPPARCAACRSIRPACRTARSATARVALGRRRRRCRRCRRFRSCHR